MKKTNLILTLVFISAQLVAQNHFVLTNVETSILDSLCNKYLEENNVPGMAIGVLKNDKIIYSKGFGVKKIGSIDAVTTKTLFHMASVSKPFVSIAIMQLVEQKKIKLDDPAINHLPYFTLNDDRHTEITIRHLLLHTSGIPDIGPSKNYDWDKPQYDEEALERFVKTLKNWKLEFKPGKKFRYSNTGYNVLGDVIAKASNQSFEDYMQLNILTPVDMKHSSFLKKELAQDLICSPHVKDDGHVVVSEIYPYSRTHAPSGTLNSNIEDMLKFASTNLNAGKYGQIEIFSAQSHKELTTPQVKRNKIIEYGLGWEIAPFRNTTRVEFSGRDVGFNTYLMMVPDSAFAIIILTNAFYNPPAFKVINSAYDIANKY